MLTRVLEPEVMSTAEEAGEYDAMDFSATDQLFAERAAELAVQSAQGVRWIVDLGSGNAKIPLAMFALLPVAALVCAVEMSAEMLVVAARNRAKQSISAQRLPLLIGDAKQCPFASTSVDMVTSNSVIHHMADPGAMFREIARIVRKSGPILIRDLVRPQSEAEVNELVTKHAAEASTLQRMLFADSLRAALSLAAVRSALDECDLKDVRVTQITDRHWSAERA